MAARDRLIVALDVQGLDEARGVVKDLGDAVSHYKVGPYLFENGLIQFIQEIQGDGKKVFLDFKSVDIGDTMRRMAWRAAKIGVEFITVMGMAGAVAAAAAGREGLPAPKILAVTLLTDYDQADMRREYNTSPEKTVEEFVCERAMIAAKAGADGVICSPREISAVKRTRKSGFLIVTPGVRPRGASSDDQKRTATPGQAMADGADYIVIGRPIIRETDKRAAAQRIIDEMEEALEPRLLRAVG